MGKTKSSIRDLRLLSLCSCRLCSSGTFCVASVGGRRRHASQKDQNVDGKSDIAIRADTWNVIVNVNVICENSSNINVESSHTPLNHSGYYMYDQVSHSQIPRSAPHSCICVFCADLRTNSDYFPIQH